MAEYIEREAAISDLELYETQVVKNEYALAIAGCRSHIRKLPAADVRPVKRGKWIDMGDFISCSSCNTTRLKEFESDYGKAKRLDARTNFCPNCGVDMREES